MHVLHIVHVLDLLVVNNGRENIILLSVSLYVDC